MTTEMMKLEPGQKIEIDWPLVLGKKLAELAPDELLSAWSLCDVMSKTLADRAKELRPGVLARIAAEGEVTTEASMKLEAMGGEFHRTLRTSVSVDEVALAALLRKHGWEDSVVFDTTTVTTTTTALNEAKLERLIASGELNDEEVKSITIKTTTEALSGKKHVYGLDKKRLLKG